MKPRASGPCFHSVVCALLWAVCGSAAAQPETANPPLRPSWQCLPDRTMAAVHIPNGKAIVDTLKETTKLGTVVFDDERVEGLRKLLASQDWWERAQKELEQYGLSLEDLPRIFAGEAGFAAVLADDGSAGRNQAEPLPLGLAWFDPGQDLARRLWHAIQQQIERHQGDDHPVTRLEIDIAGQPAMLLTIPQGHRVYGEGAFELPEDIDELDENERDAAYERVAEQAKSEMETEIRYVHLLLAERQGRMLLAFTFNSTEDARDRQRIERLTAAFERFVSVHTGEPGTFVSRLQATPGVRDALPQQGAPLFEILVDFRLLLSLATTADPDASDEDLEELKRVVEAMGIDQIGALALRTSLFDSALHTGMFLEVPSPRTGIVALLDQPVLEARPPGWVAASVVRYSHLNLDLGDLYSLIKELVIQQVGEVAEQRFDQVDVSVNAFAGADLAAILSSLGRQHTMLGFEPKPQDSEDADNDNSLFITMDRMAMVWSIEDAAIWKRLLNASRAFAGTLGEGVEYREEQGFSGYRSTMPRAEGGLFLGKGYLVLAIGEEVLAQTLSMLNHPPEGRDALVNSDVYARAAELLPLESGLSFELTDGNRYAGFLHQTLDSLFDASGGPFAELGTEEDADLKDMMKQLRWLMPTAEEFQDVFGVGVGYMRATDHGLELKTVSELPPP